MRHKKIKLCATLLLGIGLSGLQAQEAITASGGNITGSGGSVSYSVGQVFYNTYTGTNGSVAQGVQQPFEISTVAGIEDTKNITLQYSVFPNPTKNFLTLKVENLESSNLIFQLFDINGKLIENTKIEGNETSIIMTNLIPSTYFLKILQNNKEIKAFKIIKN